MNAVFGSEKNNEKKRVPRLGVNVDHVATLRQARGENYPSVANAAEIALNSGAEQITIHLREDRRHIQDYDVVDVFEVTKKLKRPLNLEMGCSDDILQVALRTKPDWVCLVPENRQERTTEGGLDLIEKANFKRVENVIFSIRKNSPHTKISLFLEADEAIIKNAILLKADAVEIHTGDYAKKFLEKKNYNELIEKYKRANCFLKDAKINIHAGHGLTLESVLPLLKLSFFEEYNIGHSIISQAIFDGLDNVVKKYIELFSANNY